jgi:hypothetical protein
MVMVTMIVVFHGLILRQLVKCLYWLLWGKYGCAAVDYQGQARRQHFGQIPAQVPH